MDDSLIILGRQPALGLAELESLYGGDRLEPVGNQAVIVHRMPCGLDFARLGGAVKICKMLTILDTTNWKDVEKFLIQVSPEHSQRMPAGKMHLGLSAYELGISPQQLLATGLSVKKAINKKTGRTVRLVPNKTADLNTAQVHHNKLTGTNGWELVFVRHGRQIAIAQTLYVQDIASYTLRDRDRPKRDARVGMLPPKLAQTIINLAVGPQEFTELAPELSNDICLQPEDNAKMHARRQGKTVLDPFCGTGVVMQEALLMGYKIKGTDLEERMIDYTKQNLEWLNQRYNLEAQTYDLRAGDATALKWPDPLDFVASEAYLGRPFTSQPSAEILSTTASDCNLIIKKFLRNIHSQLAAGTRICIAVPAWQVRKDEFKHLPLLDSLEELGYNRVSFEHARDDQLIYYREDQIVARELLVLIKRQSLSANI